MKFKLMRPNMALRKKRIKLSREVVHDLKEVSKLSSVKQWEFAGNIKYKNFRFSKPSIATSKKRSGKVVENLTMPEPSDMAGVMPINFESFLAVLQSHSPKTLL